MYSGTKSFLKISASPTVIANPNPREFGSRPPRGKARASPLAGQVYIAPSRGRSKTGSLPPQVQPVQPPSVYVKNPFGVTEIERGFPHSEILGSKPVRGSPGLIAAYHVLHRLSVPRHPPNALLRLIIYSIFHSQEKIRPLPFEF